MRKVFLILAVLIEGVYCCSDGLRRCRDGSCVVYNCPEDFCSGPYCKGRQCGPGEKFCSVDGSCVGSGRYCPCPNGRRNRCHRHSQTDDRCYSRGERCDGSSDCPNGLDEIGCLYYPSINKLVFPLTAVGLIILTSCILCLRARRKRIRLRTSHGVGHNGGIGGENIPSISLSVSRLADPPPAYDHVVNINNGDEQQVANESGSTPPDGEESKPPSYTDVINGGYWQTFSGDGPCRKPLELIIRESQKEAENHSNSQSHSNTESNRNNPDRHDNDESNISNNNNEANNNTGQTRSSQGNHSNEENSIHQPEP